MTSFSTTIYQASLLAAYRIMCQPSYQANLIFPEYLVFCIRIDHEILHHAYIIPSLLLDPLISSNPLKFPLIYLYHHLFTLIPRNWPRKVGRILLQDFILTSFNFKHFIKFHSRT